MSATPNLAIAHILQSQAQKEVTANAALDALDRALTDALAVDCAAGGTVTLAAADYTAHVFFSLTGAPAAAFTLAVPATRRLFAVANGTAQAATVSAGGATADVPAGAKHALYCDGAAVHAVGGGGGGGSADMAKAVYDPDGDGVVDKAEAVDGASSAGVSKYYGTDAAGAVGFHDLAAGAPRKLLDGTGDGATTAFTLAANPVGTVLAFVDGLLRTDYSVAGTTLTFATAPASGAAVVAWDIAGGAGHNGLWTEIARTQADDSAAVDLTFDPALYDAVELWMLDGRPATDGAALRLQLSTDGGTTWQAAGYDYAGRWTHSTGSAGTVASAAAAHVELFAAWGNAAGEGAAARVRLADPGGALFKKLFAETSQVFDGGAFAHQAMGGVWRGTAPVDGLRLVPSTGAIASGAFVLTGRLRAARGATAEPRPHRRLVRPVLADFTALAPNSAVAETELGIGVTFTALASANDFQLLARPQPAPPYAVVACVTAALPAQNFYTYALGWRESATGRLQNNAVIHSSGIKAEVNRWDDPATFNDAPQAFPIEDRWPWLRIEDDGTEHVALLSADGVAWLEVWRAPRAAFLTADQVYVGWNRNRTTSATPGRGALTIQHWEVL